MVLGIRVRRFASPPGFLFACLLTCACGGRTEGPPAETPRAEPAHAVEEPKGEEPLETKRERKVRQEDAASAAAHDPDAALALGKREGRPVVLVFCAAWVAACAELEARTFADPSVQAALADGFLVARADVTDDADPTVIGYDKRFGVEALPLILVYDGAGRQVAREVGYLGPAKLVAVLAGAR
jgi:thiol:disulfide interchange protein